MDTLSKSFTIELDGSPIAKVGPQAEDRSQATTGPDAAVFTLKDGRLQSGDWLLARPTVENRSFAPKPVLWFKPADDLSIHPVTAHKHGTSYKIKIANAVLMVDDGKVLADLSGDSPSQVVVNTV